MKLSIVVPCFNEEQALPFFFEETEKVIQSMDIDREYIFVNDGSSDQTLRVLKEFNELYPEIVHYVDFSRNFGKEAALYAGLIYTTGDFVTVMDADLQDPPELLPKMYELIVNQDYDCVGTRRANRSGEPIIRSFFANQFYKLINKISQTEMVNGARDFRLMTRQMVDAILKLSEYNRFSKGLFSWVGFKTTYLSYENKERVAGETSWSFWSLFKYSLEGIINFSNAPLLLSAWMGVVSFAISIVMMIFIVVRTIIFGNETSGWTSMVTIMLLIGGIQLLGIGVLGQYIGKIYLEVKKRPVFVIKEKR
ncbi:glycosyltransferase family 2 protein [uncultured Enterococcus sp.]|uniref:glycosyltransferase family 2 protein n=1 Tax=uncultured Enterococcus sp. TaxID=167972 RepID=UPI0025923F0B|nr:glycosyltransferase family 2 protein [uncultured Enterococcus sp.]